jgi:type VI protein secretion system component VasF
MKKCQIKDNLFFNGSTATPLDEQLKSLYLKQEFSRFVYQNQGKNSQELQQAFQAFIARTQPDDLNAPTWIAGADEELIKSQG